MAAYRASPHEATGFSPNMLMLGREVRAPIDLCIGNFSANREPISADQFVEERCKIMERSYRLVREHTRRYALRAKDNYDMRVKRVEFEPGQYVLYYNPRRFPQRSPKWQRLYQGPCLVLKRLGPANLLVQRSRRGKPFVVHIDKVKAYLGEIQGEWDSEVKRSVRNELIKSDIDVDEPLRRSQRVVRVPKRFRL